MRKTTLTLAIAAFAASPLAVGGDYQMEGGLTFQDVDFDNGDETVIGLDFTYHFDRVRTQRHPLAEAAFLERSNNVFAGYTNLDEQDLDLIDLGAEGYLEEFYLRGIVHYQDNADDETDFSVSAGYAFMPGGLATLTYDDRGPGTFSVDGKFVHNMAMDTAMNFEGSLDIVDDAADTVIIGARGDYYLNRNASVGVGLAHMDNDFDDQTSLSFGGRMFFTPMVSANIEFTIDGEDESRRAAGEFSGVNISPQDGADTLTIGVDARF